MWKTEIVCRVCGCAGIGIGIVVGCEAYRGIGSLGVIVVGCAAFDCSCVVVGNVVVCLLGTLKHVIGGNDWWYAACVCNKGVLQIPKGFSAQSVTSIFGRLCQGV